MKIGIITDAIDDGAAGIGTYVRNLVYSLLTIDKKNEYFLIHHIRSDDQFYKQFKKNERVHEIIIPIKNMPFGRELRKITTMPRILEKYDLDIIHETAQTGPFFTKSKFKKIVTIHDLAVLKYPKTQHAMAYVHHKFGIPFMLKNVNTIVAVSKNTKKDLQEMLHVPSSKIKVIYEAQAPEFKASDRKSIERIKRNHGLRDYFLFVGSLEPRKNIERIIYSFNQVRKEKNVQLVIVTKKGWKNKQIFNAIERSPYKNDIKILHGVRDDLPTLYSGARASLFVSLYEGFGLPVLESMACGCPVITSNVSSIPEVADDATISVNPFNMKEIEKAMVAVLDKKVADSLVKKGFKNIQRFSWKKAAQETLKVYRELR
jgi:glycosyltransferase involved in cell wall biosynthesis